MSEYVYASDGEVLMNIDGEISLPRKRIVHCRDCAYSFDGGKRCDTAYLLYVEPDGFCAWGERREDG